MTHYVCFSNPGEIDIEAAVTLGVNVKPEAGAIGYFGTGLKYAIAVLMRHGCSLRIRSGKQEYTFEEQERMIRGEPFQMIVMREVLDPTPPEGSRRGKRRLGFTSAFGRNWGLRDAYRELWSNMRDEGGMVELVERLPRSRMQGTQIIVRGEEFLDVHRNAGDFILPRRSPAPKLLHADEKLEVYEGGTRFVFYKGFAAYENRKNYGYTFNILKDMTLTEDRKLVNWEAEYEIKSWLLAAAPPEIVKETIAAPKERAESEFFYSSYTRPSPEFISAVRATPKERLNATARDIVGKLEAEGEFLPPEVCVDGQGGLGAAVEDLSELDFPFTGVKFRIVESGWHVASQWFPTQRTVVLREGLLTDEDALWMELIRMHFAVRGYKPASEALDTQLLTAVTRLARRLSREGN